MDDTVASQADLNGVNMNASASFVLTPILVDRNAIPYAFPDGSILDRATVSERDIIKGKLRPLIGSIATDSLETFYESKATTEETLHGNFSHRVEALPESDWNYYVVRYPENVEVNLDLHYAASVCETPIDLTSFHFSMAKHGWRPFVLQQFFMFRSKWQLPYFDLDSLQEVAKTYELLVAATGGAEGKGDFPEIRRALHMLDSLSDLPPYSGFLCLGLFAIIEMLITHNPRLEDRGDSITHQMKSKIPLLSRRFVRPLPLSKYFGDTSSEKIWSTLYSYRSSLAHGGVPNFEKDHRVLVSEENADNFLLETVKSLIHHALREPYLYRDLRDC